MADIIIIAVIALAVGLAMSYIMKEKKKGVKCIGCPMAGGCSHGGAAASEGGGTCGCHSNEN